MASPGVGAAVGRRISTAVGPGGLVVRGAAAAQRAGASNCRRRRSGAANDASPRKLDRLIRRLDDDSFGPCGWARPRGWIGCWAIRSWSARDAPAEAAAGRRPDWAPSPAGKSSRPGSGHARAWLLSDPAGWDLPAVSPRQIEGWLDALTEPARRRARSAGARRRRETAERELLDLLARDQYVPQVKKAIEARLAGRPAGQPPRSAVGRAAASAIGLDQAGNRGGDLGVSDGLRPPPLLAGAELPGRRAHPLAEGAPGPSCSTAWTTAWPIALAAIRFRWAIIRWAGLSLARSRRAPSSAWSTCPRRGADGLPLLRSRRRIETPGGASAGGRWTTCWPISGRFSEPELAMLGGLDQAEVSRFPAGISCWSRTVRWPRSGPPRLGGHRSRFGMISARLADEGTRAAMPGLAEAVAEDRFLPPNSRGHMAPLAGGASASPPAIPGRRLTPGWPARSADRNR